MRKLTFERAILIVLIVIVFISTTEIREKYTEIFIDKFIKKDIPVISDIQEVKNNVFPTMLLTADNLYSQGNYEQAAKEYFTSTLNTALTVEQKARSNFRLGICHYNLKNYQLAFKSFVEAAELSPNDSVIYNNAAVSAYKARDMKNAITYQTKALKLLPAVEYYYNLARMYEDNEQYDLSAENYLIVAKAEQNLTETDKIDPVRVKEKVARLLPNSQVSIVSDMVIGLKLKSTGSEILTVNENEMQVKQGDFIVRVENQKGTRNIVAEYDRKKYDPYNLITDMIWTVYKNGKQIYKNNNDRMSFNNAQVGNYEVRLNIKYNSIKEMTTSKTVKIKDNQSSVGAVVSRDQVVTPKPIKRDQKTYDYAIYEQLFESDFNISNKSYTDKYSVVWGKDQGVSTGLLYDEKAIDKKSVLFIKNTNDNNDSGVWINLDNYIKANNIADKKIRISFYTKAMTETTVLNIKARLRMGDSYINIPLSYELKDKWEENNIYINTPQNTDGFTISITTTPGKAFKMDAFIIVD